MENLVFTNFLINAKKNTYAIVNDIQKIKMADGGTELSYREGNLFYRDRYYGGEPFIAEEIISFEDTVIWGMNLRGKVVAPDILPVEKVYAFVREALKNMSYDTPFRGPAHYQIDNLRYASEVAGSLEHFYGTEKIYLNNLLTYEGFYHGGSVGKK
jgi:hypothetical protein